MDRSTIYMNDDNMRYKMYLHDHPLGLIFTMFISNPQNTLFEFVFLFFKGKKKKKKKKNTQRREIHYLR